MLAGFALSVAFAVGGRPAAGGGAAAIMVAYAAFLWFGARNDALETVALLAGRHDDERREQISIRASAHPGWVVLAGGAVQSFLTCRRRPSSRGAGPG